MKKYLLAVILIGALTHPGFAQTSPRRSTEAMLEASLSSLKESYQNLISRNDFLSSGIAVYKTNIRYLHNELKFLEARKHELSGRSGGEGSAEKGVRGQWEEKIERLRQDISLLQERINSQSPAARQMARQKEKDALLSSVWRSRRDLRKAQEKLEGMERESVRSSETIAHLRRRQAALKRPWPEKQDRIHQRLAVLKEDNVRLKKEMASLEHAMLNHAGPPAGRHD
jgi:chromosome segregation ATPase